MTKSLKLFLLAILTATFIGGSYTSAKADEGMWLPFLVKRLNYEDMQKKGLKLTAEEIYSVNNSSLKDAIVQFGNGCTGEIISDQGLILTNHHCGFGKIQEHSTIEHDYLTDGFWAYKKSEELQNPGFFVKFLVSIEDVTAKVLAGVTDDLTTDQRNELIKKVIDGLQKENTSEGKYEVIVKPFFNGNEYYMFIMQTFNDVRLVGAPPSSIGKYGGDTDNWMWPRHTGDFSIFRVYTAPDGSPASYSPDNIPMKPKHHLPISLEGVQNNDFAMILGYPGGTDRYMTSYGVEHNLKMVYPTRIKIRRAKLDIYSEGMDADAKVRIQYASKYARVANYWKNFIGMSKGLVALKVADKKRATEQQLTEWIASDENRTTKYGKALADINSAYTIVDQYATSRYYFIEAIYSGPEALNLSMSFQGLLTELKAENPDQEKIKTMIEGLQEKSKSFFKDYDMTTDRKVWAKMMDMYHQDVAIDQQPDYLISAAKKAKGNYSSWADKVYEKSIFTSEEKLNAFLSNPSAKVLEKDPIYDAMNAFFSKFKELQAKAAVANEQLDRGNRLFIDALRKMETTRKFYPDANFTMRLTYGTVKDYYPQDAVHFQYYTTLAGVMQKEDPSNPEFVVAPKLKEIYEKKDYGVYGEGNTMKVCFLTDNDITGGNSGSPVINGKGQLIGLAFDGNWEAMSGDIAFEPELQRTISVDIRYVLLIIDKYAGAKNLIDELTLVNKKVL